MLLRHVALIRAEMILAQKQCTTKKSRQPTFDPDLFPAAQVNSAWQLFDTVYRLGSLPDGVEPDHKLLCEFLIRYHDLATTLLTMASDITKKIHGACEVSMVASALRTDGSFHHNPNVVTRECSRQAYILRTIDVHLARLDGRPYTTPTAALRKDSSSSPSSQSVSMADGDGKDRPGQADGEDSGVDEDDGNDVEPELDMFPVDSFGLPLGSGEELDLLAVGPCPYSADSAVDLERRDQEDGRARGVGDKSLESGHADSEGVDGIDEAVYDKAEQEAHTRFLQ